MSKHCDDPRYTLCDCGHQNHGDYPCIVQGCEHSFESQALSLLKIIRESLEKQKAP